MNSHHLFFLHEAIIDNQLIFNEFFNSYTILFKMFPIIFILSFCQFITHSASLNVIWDCTIYSHTTYGENISATNLTIRDQTVLTVVISLVISISCLCVLIIVLIIVIFCLRNWFKKKILKLNLFFWGLVEG